VKIGSSSLTTKTGAIDESRIEDLVATIAKRVTDGHQVLLVSSGAIATGMAPLGLLKRPKDLATQQAAASVGQGLLIARYTHAFAQALAGERTGTYFAPTGNRPSTRLLWLAHAAVAQGSLKLDDGAVEAITVRRASLLPAGITAATGTFEAGDPVDLTDEAGTPVARGLVNYDASELPAIMGRSTRWLASKLGPEYEREVIHRDDLVIL
jgi:glutamate 5-kinase